jgi:hypothetical protein
MPHKHSPRSKRSRAKRERFRLLLEYRLLPKVWDPERCELISLRETENFEMGEVLKSPRFTSPSLKRLD